MPFFSKNAQGYRQHSRKGPAYRSASRALCV